MTNLRSISFSCGAQLFTIQWREPGGGWSPKHSAVPGLITTAFQVEIADSFLDGAEVVFGNDTMRTEKQAVGSTSLDYATLNHGREGAEVTRI